MTKKFDVSQKLRAGFSESFDIFQVTFFLR